MGGRFLTFNSVIRVNQIEVTRNDNAGVDEYKHHTPENVEALRDAFGRGWPDGRMTWALSWQALHDQRPCYRAVRELVTRFHRQYGDDITFIPGGFFAPMYNTREQVNRDLHEGLARVSEIVGQGYRSASVIAGFLSADSLHYLADQEDVHVCQGQVWSQYAIDNGDGDGSICYPYYPSREHFCKPAQAAGDFIDCANLDGWTVDFLAGRRAGFTDGFNSRLGVGPIETIGGHGPEIGLRQMLATTSTHLDTGFALNGWGWVTNCWEVCLVPIIGHLATLTTWLQEIRRRWPNAACPTLGEFGQLWRQHYRDNAPLDYRFSQRGTGIGGSDADREIRWFMNQQFRLALLRDWTHNAPWEVVDYTRYDLPAQEPQGIARNWSLLGQINQKQTRPQDKPRAFSALPAADQGRILARYPTLAAELQ